ncbi:hypothetical protein MLD38_027143 [Melastoma candidum]|uniref:Uncharacterized protein n=1 Tax=Melastoma candidum TaxID=119954 RepID=A0ACB9P0S7_9MYRT|nr:hypothetical protein MLD38_027143 [Melastoma candidum]
MSREQRPLLLLSFLLLCLFCFLPSSSSSLNDQGHSLLSWKSQLGSPDVLPDWIPSDPTPCRWSGITCGPDGRVIELDLKYVDLQGKVPRNLTALAPSLRKLVLSGTNLTGPIPSELGSLGELTYLDLSDNALTGPIPSVLCGLYQLEELYLNSNQLEGSIPGEIGNLTSLKWLILFDNQLGGEIPGGIGQLGSLEVLRAGGNKNIHGALPPEIGNCTSLVMIGLAETSISGFLPSTIGQLKNLETLAIYTAMLSGQIPAEIGDCTSLQNIYLYENSISGPIPSNVGKLRNLQSLLLWQNNLVGAIPPEIGSCEQLVLIDVSMNALTGSLPQRLGNLTQLQELQLSVNQISGNIPPELGKCRELTHIELDNNQITGTVPSELGNLPNLTLLFLWQNKLEGMIPESISNCANLEAVDFSQNGLTGPIPKGIFLLQKLNKLLLLANNISGSIPAEIGQAKSLVRFRASNNLLDGEIPPTIGNLTNLNFLDLGSNRLTGVLPETITGCRNLTFLDLHSNSLSGSIPQSLEQLGNLQFVDFSDNLMEGPLSGPVGLLRSLTKLVLARNKFSGEIPDQLGQCTKLQLLDLSSNNLSGNIPASLGRIPALEIALNLSCNSLSGNIPPAIADLDRLGVLDISYNQLSGDLRYIAGMQNLVVLNISHNDFSGRVPDSPFFTKLPLSVLTGNPLLCFPGNDCSPAKHGGNAVRRATAARVAMIVLLCTACALLLAALYIILGGLKRKCPSDQESQHDVDIGPPWEVTLYQKLDLSMADVTKCLTASNVIGHGRTGVVYKVTVPSGLTVAAKKFRSSDKASAAAFSSEIATLARIRHRNIVRLLGWGANRMAKLLFYDYLPNGTLAALLHDNGAGATLGWEVRFKIALGVAEGLAYLHHDCVPPILHRDVKAHNILLGDRYEACLADFGLARLVEDENGTFPANPQFAGSYGYMAPEYACMTRITRKSDVYSYGVVLLEIITGKRPVDLTFPDGQHVIQWVRGCLNSKKDPVDILDPNLQGHPDTQIQEMLQALGIALLCTSNRPEDRPTTKDVVALLNEIRHEPGSGIEPLKANNSHAPSDNPRITPLSSSSAAATPAEALLLRRSMDSSSEYSSPSS